MKTASVAHVHENFKSVLQECQAEPVIVTRKGKAIAVLLAIGNDDDLKALLGPQPPHLSEILNAARRRVRQEGAIPHAEFWRQVEAVKTTKARNRPKKKTA